MHSPVEQLYSRQKYLSSTKVSIPKFDIVRSSVCDLQISSDASGQFIWPSQINAIWMQPPVARLNIKTVFPRYGDSYVKDKTVGETVLSLTWESLYW